MDGMNADESDRGKGMGQDGWDAEFQPQMNTMDTDKQPDGGGGSLK
jgi:hypothetical protein